MLHFKYILTFALCFLVTYLSPAQGQVLGDCTNPSTNANVSLVNNSACYFKPKQRTINVYSIYLCASAPAAPTSNSAIGLASCTLIFYNPSGAQAVIDSTTANNAPNLSGNTATVASKSISASHIYVEFSPISTTQATQQFSNLQTGTDATTGNYCWTTNNTIFILSNTLPVSACGSSAVVGGVQTEKLNSLGGTLPFSATASFTNAGPNADVTVNAYLLTTEKKLASAAADSMGSIVMLGAVYPLAESIFVNPTLGLITKLNFTWGAEAFRSGAGKTFIEGGPFTVKFSAK